MRKVFYYLYSINLKAGKMKAKEEVLVTRRVNTGFNILRRILLRLLLVKVIRRKLKR
jgi:hypothetical protein